MTTVDELFGARAAVVIDGAIGPAAAAGLCAQLAWTSYHLLDRGSYQHAAVDPAAPGFAAALAALVGLAEDTTGGALAIESARALRLGPGDYLLAHHDRSDDDAHPVELALDLSAAAVEGAPLSYRRHGQVFLEVPARPGVLAIVERGPGVAAHHGYVSKRRRGAAIVRLMVRLRRSPSASGRS